ncbi:MAG: hypothetical protein CMJ83_13145 [Planctomycetes bacterium]|nr:hypothetical protein [Planctomycetota bacterium]
MADVASHGGGGSAGASDASPQHPSHGFRELEGQLRSRHASDVVATKDGWIEHGPPIVAPACTTRRFSVDLTARDPHR